MGHAGSETRAQYGSVGAAVNLARRIQARARRGEVVISEEFPSPGAEVTIKHSRSTTRPRMIHNFLELRRRFVTVKRGLNFSCRAGGLAAGPQRLRPRSTTDHGNKTSRDTER